MSTNKRSGNESESLGQIVFPAQPTQQAIVSSLNRSVRNRRPRHNEINWPATIQKNLKHFQPEYKTIIPKIKIGYGRKHSALRDVEFCLDQSGSMGTSVIYSGISGSVMASIPAIKTTILVFHTAVADVTGELTDSVELLFGIQLAAVPTSMMNKVDAYEWLTDVIERITSCQSLQ